MVLAYWSYGKVLVRSCGITQAGAISVMEVKSCEQSLLQFVASNSNRQKRDEWSPTESCQWLEKQQKQQRLE
jgi:hypothetical protein